MALAKEFQHPYEFDPKYEKAVAYFSMEFAIDQALKTYSGGLGFLAGSHMRSAYDLNQNVVGIGVLWKYGYYDQVRRGDQTMDALFQEKLYSFLVDTKIKFQIEINKHPVWVKALFLPPKTFGTVPMFFLSTDLPENDHLAQSTSHKLYDSDPGGKVAQSILLGVGGAKLLDELGHEVEKYHLNEAHALSAAFYLYNKNKDLDDLKEKLVFTTHTPEEAGNEKHDIRFLEKLGFFCGVPMDEVRKMAKIEGEEFNHTLVALRLSKIANGVSRIHGQVANKMWGKYSDICPIISITNAQNKKYWADKDLYRAMESKDDEALIARKRQMKSNLFYRVADQTGKIFDDDVLTIVWARRFAAYKRPDLITQDQERFGKLINNSKRPVQIIWAGKPYPMDYNARSMFDNLVHMSKYKKNVAVLVGYELHLSKLLKAGSDVWLNNPRIPREASGTSGMTASMNGSVNFSTYDGWIPEFAKHKVNSFIVPEADLKTPTHQQDVSDMENLFDILENDILPTYYDNPKEWWKIVKSSMQDVSPYFDADRMAYQYYEKVYNY
ncbi:MAG TPA: alpha-glucan family phosphorylase [Cytophagales bacterium]|jgi:starch phosphorylase|nr:alpha-glucan family phosphorylase [Cytophagales bacterium]